MCNRSRVALLCSALAAIVVQGASRAAAQDARVPVAEQRTEARQETVYRPEYVTELRDVYRTVYVPVTQYHWEARWRPLQSPNWAWQPVAHVRWETRVEKSQVPYTSQHYVAETRTVQTPYLALRFAGQQRSAPIASASQQAPGNINLAPGTTTARAPAMPATPQATASPHAAPAPSRIADDPRLGGILRMDSDPPRRGRLLR
jgi:hypothetical protein